MSDVKPELLIFDVGGVLAVEMLEWKLADLAARHRLAPGLLLEDLEQLRRPADLGQASEEDFWRLVLARQGITADAADLALEPYLEPVPGMPELLERLRGRVRLAVLSNDSRELAAARRRVVGYGQLVEAAFISAHTGLLKPEPEVYLQVCRELGVEPARSLMVDDREANVTGARRAGLQAVIFRHARQLGAHLKALGLGDGKEPP